MKKSTEKLVVLILLFSFFSCTGYKDEGDAVYYRYWNEGSGQHKEKLEANPKTFKVLKYDSYAKDDKNVFYNGERVIGADAATFEALGDYYAKDKNYGWYEKDTVQDSDGKNFKVVNEYYSTDGKDYYYETKPLKMTDPLNFKFVHGEGEYNCWTTDGKYYYYNNYKVPSDDYDHLTIFKNSGGISKDRHWAYFLDHKLNFDTDGNRVVDTIDIASFQVTGYIECHDKYSCFNVYHGREKCPE